ncbi:hypothetical protein L1987_23129 [Smallanthus sonchifolius]|uniref:Uncharacterized protein n=1 Tax=Smallanthus sonchifolius TaxID=185202 RepID=A0ACB9IG32_9ASTR|nr:hypothetical protein L1987_23129 [Smallanthus sonchifolius]
MKREMVMREPMKMKLVGGCGSWWMVVRSGDDGSLWVVVSSAGKEIGEEKCVKGECVGKNDRFIGGSQTTQFSIFRIEQRSKW